MKKNVVKIMTSLLLLAFIIMAITGLTMRFGVQPEWLQQFHSITGMILILLVLYHWHLFLRIFWNMWKKQG